jgi:probable rRNA maturation factor
MGSIINFHDNSGEKVVPEQKNIERWAHCVFHKLDEDHEITISIINDNEMRELNKKYRGKDYATNVLSFPYEPFEGEEGTENYLGDIVLCASVIVHEADEQQKDLFPHWAHMIIHGILHLLGYDHEIEQDAMIMEALEIELLNEIGYKNPYEIA